MEMSIKALGRITRCMDSEFSNGLMGKFILESIRKIRNMDVGPWSGRIKESMKGSGLMDFSMAKEFTNGLIK
jgi:hypothetical protein